MPETDVQAAPSAAAVETAPITSMDAMTPAQRTAYLKTGEFPTASAETEVSDAAAPGQDKADESGAAPEAAAPHTKPQTPKPDNRAERRYQTLANENKALKARLDALEKAQPSAPAKPQDTKPAATDTQAKNPPRLKDFSGDDAVEKWEDALHAYNEAQRKDAVREAIREEREAQKTADREADAQKAKDKVVSAAAKRIADYRKTLTEDHFDEHLHDVETFCTSHGLRYLDDAISESEACPQLVSYFGENPEELERLAGMSATAALRELGRLEVSEKIKGPAPKNRTAAKKLGTEVRGTGSTFDEDAELLEAAKNGDMKTYDRIRAKQEAAERSR